MSARLRPPRPDRISVTGVRAHGRHGVLESERAHGQEFVVDVGLDVDTRAAAEADDLRLTVNYAQVAVDVVDEVEGEPVDLIETLAGRIVRRVLHRYEAVQAVEVTVHKPQAPVGVPFGDVTVRIHRRRRVPVVIALGANLEDPSRTLAAAVADLRRAGLVGVRRSGLFETDPVGGPEQPAYLNAVVTAMTALAPGPLLALLHRIEDRHGRTRDVRWGARTLDLDLVGYGTPGEPDHVSGTRPGGLVLPHPRAHERAFVLRPWLDVDPDALLATASGPARVADLLDSLDPALASGVRTGPAWPS